MQNDTALSAVVTLNEAARLLQVSRRTMIRHLADVQAVKVFGRWKIRLDALNAVIVGQRRDG